MGIPAIECDRIKRGREALGITVFRKRFKPAIRFKGVAFTGKHTRWILALTLKRKYTGCIGELAGEIF